MTAWERYDREAQRAADILCRWLVSGKTTPADFNRSMDLLYAEHARKKQQLAP